MATAADGDARRALGALEIAVKSSLDTPVRVTLVAAQDSIQKKYTPLDPTGDAHYDLASAFIKSMRGSDADAAIYWLARMLEGGEDARFIARRIIIFASEDVGNADPQALLVAVAAAEAVDRVGLPECQLNLAQAVTYLATAPKSRASNDAILEARADVRNGVTMQVPKHLRDAHYAGAKKLGHGVREPDTGDAPSFLPEPRRYYRPGNQGLGDAG